MDASRIQFPNGKVISREWLEANPVPAQSTLRAHRDSHPLCLCNKTEPVPVYIAKKQHYYLARMPGTGPRHASYCSFYGPPPNLSGQSTYRQSAIQRDVDDDQHVKVKITDSLGVFNPGPGLSTSASTPSEDTGDPKKQRAKMTLRGLLHLIWETAEFNRWYPKMAGKRNYHVLYKYLQSAMGHIEVKGAALSNFLYMPEPFKTDFSEIIRKRANRRLYDLLMDEQGRPKRMLALGLVKKFIPADDGLGIRLAHAPKDLIFWMDIESAERFMRKECGGMTFEDLLAGEHHQVILLIIEKSPKSNFIVRKAAMLTVNQEYLPIRDEFEKALVESMKPSRMFIKQLAYDAGSDAVIPSFLLLDVGEEPLPMYIFGHRGNKKQIMTVYSAVKSMEENEEPCWYWDTRWDTHKWPELPPPRKPAGVSHVKH